MSALRTTCQVCAAPTDGYLCRDGATELERWLGDLPALLRELDVVVARRAQLGTTPGSRRAPGSRSVVDFTAADLRTEVVDELLRLACLVGADEISSTRVIGWLLGHVGDIRLHPDASEVYDRVKHYRRRLERAVDRRTSRVYAGPCDAARTDVVTEDRDGTVWTQTVTTKRAAQLYAAAPVFDKRWLRDQADEGRVVTITCDGWTPDGRSTTKGCGHVHDLADRDTWLVQSLHDALLPLDDLRAALPRLLPLLTWPNRSTWSRWLKAGRLTPRGVDRHGQDTYRGGDAIELVEREQARIVGNANKRTRKAAG